MIEKMIRIAQTAQVVENIYRILAQVLQHFIQGPIPLQLTCDHLIVGCSMFK